MDPFEVSASSRIPPAEWPLLPALGLRQNAAALILWLIAVGTTLALNLGPARLELPAVAFFSVMVVAATWMSTSLSMSAHLGRIATALVVTGIAVGIARAMLIGLTGGLIATLGVLLLRRPMGLARLDQRMLFTAGLWNTAAVSLALLPAGWIYGLSGGSFDLALADFAEYGHFLVFVALYCLAVVLLLALWLIVRGIPARTYLAETWPTLALNGPVPMLLAPLVGLSYRMWPDLRLLILAGYVLGSFFFYRSDRATAGLASRLGHLRALNRIGQVLNASLEMDALLAAIHRELSVLVDTSDMYLALYDEAGSRMTFPMAFTRGKPEWVPPRAPANGFSEYIIRTCQPLVLNENPLEEARRLGIEPIGAPPCSFLGVPVMAVGKTLGVLALRDYRHSHAYSTADLQLLETVAAQAGSALRNASLYRRSQQQAAELSSLHRISLMASASLVELDEVLGTICHEAVNAMPFQKAAIFLLDDEGATLTLVQSAGLSHEYRSKYGRYRMDDSPRAEAFRTGLPFVVEDVESDPRVAGFAEAARREGYRAVLDIPLHSGERVIGTFAAYYAEPHRFDPGEVELLQTLGGQSAIAIENARLFDATRARTRELQTLYDANTAVNASLSLRNSLVAVATSMIHALQTTSCTALIASEDGTELRAELTLRAGLAGVVEEKVEPRTLALKNMPAVQAAVREQRALVFDACGPPLSEEECRLLDPYGDGMAVALPLVARGTTVGLIVSGAPDRARTFQPEQLRVAEALANQAAVAIENAALFERTDVALGHRREEIASLERISQRMTRRLDDRAVIEQVMLAAAEATGAELGEVALYDPNTNVLTIAAQHSTFEDLAPEREWLATRGITGRAIQTGQTVLVGDVRADPDYYAGREGIVSELVVPIMLEGERLGLINLESTRVAAFTPEHARFVTNLAEHAAIAIKNARLFETVNRRAEEFSTLRNIAMELLSTSDVKHALRVIARGAMDRTRAKDLHIYLYNQATDRLTFGTSLWANGEVDREFAPPRPNGLTATVARTKERIVVPNMKQHPLFSDEVRQPEWMPEDYVHLEAIIGVPLKRGDEVIGVFNIAFEDPALVNEENLVFLDLLTAQAAVAIANAELQEQTRTGRDLLQAILDSSHDGILMYDMDERLVMANSRVDWLLNLRLTDMIGQHFRSVARTITQMEGLKGIFTAVDAHKMAAQIKDNPMVITRRRYTIMEPNGRPIEEITLPVTSDTDELLGRMFILRDMTQERELEAFRQEMSHMLVHDLRSPLGGLITGVHTALEEIEDGSRNERGPDLGLLSTVLNVSLTSAQALLRLVEAILDVNKLETGEVPLRKEQVDLRSVAERALQPLLNTARQGEIKISIEAPRDLEPIWIDADKIERVFSNLLDNALRYTPQGGRVWVTIESAEVFQTVTVRDTGDGIPADLRDRIFERFVQADTSRRKRGSKGSGLGLTFCRLAVEAHGGRIWVDDGPEGGAAFHFSLPVG